jgi:RNA-splicing ligase RtcB
MEDGVLICEGKSNAAWNYSAPHGAGRVLSRTKAKEVINLDSAKESMKAKNIYSSNVPIDEVKGAYKDSAIIEKAIEPTVDILDRIIPIHNIKDDKNDEPPWRKKK